MSKKKDADKIRIQFCGNSANEVTGSATLITIGDKEYQYLIEFGLRQSANKIDDMKENNKKMPFKSDMLNCVILCHNHIDHSGRICLLVKNGFRNPIYIPKGNKEILKHLWEDSQGIIERDCMEIGKKKGNYIEPLYSKEDVEQALDLIQEIEFNEKFIADDGLTFEFIHNSHIVNAASCVLWLKNRNGQIKKVLYTSDMGNLLFENETPYVKPLDKIEKCNYIISECTYGDKTRISKYEDRKKDVEKITMAHSHSGCSFRFISMCTRGTEKAPPFSICRPYQ
jgi:metallo-beta-lactamase family protein